ncbi:MAG: dTMP kinase [Coriobacteriaceae bacterium]|nr:dTMP kinase [Coriobacteriaceae bacterium]MDO4891261.1 dTMP kinase [Coriobacteriaceae bacterium]
MGIGEGKGEGPGIFITFEGGDGAGKTTHLNFLANALRQQGCEVVCLREPGGTSIGEDLRAVVLDENNSAMADETELLIYEAARAQLVREVIIPALQQDKVVLCDRFYDSTIAYQAYGRGLPIQAVKMANNFACQGVHPCRTIMLTTGDEDDSVLEGLQRATKHGEADRLEQAGIAFHANVRRGFREIAEANPERIRVVSSAVPKPQTARAVFREIADIFEWGDVDERFGREFFDSIELVNTDAKAVVDQGSNPARAE